MPLSTDNLGVAFEDALAIMPAAIDAILDYRTRQGASDETLVLWETILDLVADPDRAAKLAQELGMA